MSPALQVDRNDADDAEDPRNRLLDGLEAMIEAFREQGMEYQLRTRLARLLPPPVVMAKETVVVRTSDPNAEIEQTFIISGCSKLAKRDLSSLEHKIVAQMKARAEAELAVLREGRGA